MAKIQITLPDGREDTHDLLDETVTVGRQPDNTIVIEDVSVSGHHAKLTRSGSDEYQVEDLGSTNGTRLNGEPVKEGQALDDGDLIRFGKVESVYHSSARKGARPLPEAEKVEARVGEGSHKPAGFGNVSPFKKRRQVSDPLARAAIGVGLFAIGAFVLAVLRVLLLQPPG